MLRAPRAYLRLTASRRRLRGIRAKCGLPSDAVAFGLPSDDWVAAERSEDALCTGPVPALDDLFGSRCSGGAQLLDGDRGDQVADRGGFGLRGPGQQR
jgi:hypothetical protein